MKTKHILTALALPALFAACTAEDVVNEGTVALQERPTVQNLTVRVIEGAESRYAVNGASSLKFNFENGDKFGAAIIDQYDPSYPTRPDLWDVIPSLAGNTPFTFNATSGEWKAPEDLPMGLGHYLFVYPYNRADVNRAAVSYELPAVQKLYTEEDGEIDLNAAIEAGNKSFYSTVVTSPDLEDLEIELENLYAYPKFVINFDNGEKVTTVSKVVLAKKGGFEVKGGFNHEVVSALFANGIEDFWGTNSKETDWNKVQTADLLTSDENYATIETSPYLVAELPLDAEVEKVTNNKVIEVRFMIPGVLMEDLDDFNDYEMYIYTNNGVYSVGEDTEDEVVDFEDAIAWKNTTKTSSKLKAFARGTANTITINKNYVVKAENEKYIVTSIADWNALVEQYGDEDKFVGDDAVEVVVVGGSLVLDETADMPTEAEFKVNALTVKGEVELCNVIAGEVTVDENATLTTCGSFEAAKVTNEGTLNIEAVYNKSGKSQKYSGVAAIENYGTVNVEKEAIAEFYLTNMKGAVLENEGTISIYNYDPVAADDLVQFFGNNGTINNEGTINMYDYTNLAPEYKNRKLVNMPTINNEGKILIKGDVTNFGTVINEGTLSCKNLDGVYVNETSGILDAKVNGLTYITKNKGEVIVYAPFQEDLVIEKRGGKVTYTTSEAKEAFYTKENGNSYVNNLNISDDYTIEAGTISTLNVNGSAEITRGWNKTDGFVGHVNNLVVTEGTTVLANDFYLNSIYVAEDALIRVLEDVTLVVSGANYHDEDGAIISAAFLNEGEIEVEGKLKASKISGKDACVGVVTESGANSYIYWLENADEDDKNLTKKEALAAALAEYMDDEDDSHYQLTFTLDLEEFNAHLNRIQSAGVQGSYEDGDYYFKKYAIRGEVVVTQEEMDAAADYIATEGKEDLIKALKSMNITYQDNTLYKPDYYANGSVKKTAKAVAYDNFQKYVKETEIGQLTYSERYAAIYFDDSEIEAILAEAAPYAYIWEGCILDQLADLWVAYDGMFQDNDYDANNADKKTLVAFFEAAIKKTQALHVEVKGKMPEGVDLKFLNDLDYTDEQVAACCGANQTSTTALAGSLK